MKKRPTTACRWYHVQTMFYDLCCKRYSFVTVKVWKADCALNNWKFCSEMSRFFFSTSPSNYCTFCQVWGESTAWLHLPAACQITGCRQKYSYLRAHSQPHWGPQCLLTHMEGGELLCPLLHNSNSSGLKGRDLSGFPACLFLGLQVSHVFSGYGPGVRYVHFLHRLKNMFMVEFSSTTFTDSSVIFKPTKTSS